LRPLTVSVNFSLHQFAAYADLAALITEVLQARGVEPQDRDHGIGHDAEL
jgi:EAL domain-containing protein (putative c-di-GMP-specific phosphodiesterase class I)